MYKCGKPSADFNVDGHGDMCSIVSGSWVSKPMQSSPLNLHSAYRSKTDSQDSFASGGSVDL